MKVGIAVFGAGVISRFVGQKIICGIKNVVVSYKFTYLKCLYFRSLHKLSR